LLDRLTAQLEERLGQAIFSYAGESMEEVVGLKLTVGRYSLAVAESCTGGLIAQTLDGSAGRFEVLRRRRRCLCNETKTRALGRERAAA